MPTIHFLNVKEGDCSVIRHLSGRISVIDVCNAETVESTTSGAKSLETAMMAEAVRGTLGNFNQKSYPVNPIQYLDEHGITSIFRYIQSHPDMDHMDGIKSLFEAFEPQNFWDTDNKKELDSSSWNSSPYNAEDWKFYKHLRDSDPEQDPKRLTLLSGANGKFWNQNENGSGGGDGIKVLAPTQTLVNSANKSNDNYNDCSYVLLYRTHGHRIVFGGDSHDATWEHILATWEKDVTDIDLLIAPHHGRDSGRSYGFLDVLKPTLTFFGNARSEHLAYSEWSRRDLAIITNNQANCMVVDIGADSMHLYVTHETFAKKVNPSTYYDEDLKAWFAYVI
ncbi:ComEC/Rec2 family competence protein [Candidatus Poriferisocius sp.]|uniref:ComEC/Rec2 family competence protein n=1 Tax=Candidatus Poriferisocius sp. TaxID=3101276 RepID=UPI003B02843E